MVAAPHYRPLCFCTQLSLVEKYPEPYRGHQFLESRITGDPSVNFTKLPKIENLQENSQNCLEMMTNYLAIQQACSHGNTPNW